jgi:hypothetical protein
MQETEAERNNIAQLYSNRRGTSITTENIYLQKHIRPMVSPVHSIKLLNTK